MRLLWVTGGFALAALLGVYLPWTAWVLPVGIGCLAASLVCRLAKRWPPLRRLLFGAAAALLWLTAYGALVLSPAQAMAYRTVRLEAVVTQWPQETEHGATIPVKAGEGDGRKCAARFVGGKDLADLRPGDRFSCVAYCTPADRIRGKETLYYAGKGVQLHLKGYGEVTVDRCEGVPLRYAPAYLAQEIRQLLDRLYPPDQAGFLQALLTGEKSGLEEGAQHQFNRVGLSHVVVISGLHVTFLVGFLTLFLNPRRNLTLGVLLAVLVGFCLMTGSAPGTVRATILCILSLLAPRLGREYHAVTGLCAALLFLLALNPYSVADAGLQFSFLSTLGILLFGQRWERAWSEPLPRRLRPVLRPVLGVVAISLSAMVFTVPLSALYFGRFALAAPVANLATGWSVTAAFVGGALSVAAGALWLPLGEILAAVVGLPIRFFLWFAQQASRWSLASLDLTQGYYALWLLFAYGVVLLVLLCPGKGKRPVIPVCACVATFCLSALLTARTTQRQDLILTVLDVGQGQSVAVTSGRTRALIDCGGTLDPGDAAATYLQSTGSSVLDLLVLTHFHADHAGGVPELLDRLTVRAIAAPDVDPDDPLRQTIEEKAKAQGVPLYFIKETSQTTLGEVQLTLYEPQGGEGDANERCLSVLCALEDWQALITGDLPAAGEDLLVARKDLPDGELLVAGHHGSRTSTGQRLLEAFRPETAVISVGHNSYGHPAPETLTRLEQAGTTVYRTDHHGRVTVTQNREEPTWQNNASPAPTAVRPPTES